MSEVLDLEIKIDPIGVIRTSASVEEVRKSWIAGGVEGYVEVFKEYLDGLRGLEGFSHLLLLVWLHRTSPNQRRVLIVRPRVLTRFGFPLEKLPEVGVFATDSPHRPNPIGIEVVELLRIEGNKLIVKGLDVYDGTPVIDIRPLTEDYIPAAGLRYPRWLLQLKEEVKKFFGKNVKI